MGTKRPRRTATHHISNPLKHSSDLLISEHEQFELLLTRKESVPNPFEGLSSGQWRKLIIVETGLGSQKSLAEKSRRYAKEKGLEKFPIAESTISKWVKNPGSMTWESLKKVELVLEWLQYQPGSYSNGPIKTALRIAWENRLLNMATPKELRRLRIGALSDLLEALTDGELEELCTDVLDILSRQKRINLLGNEKETERYLKAASVLNMCDPKKANAGQGLGGISYEEIDIDISPYETLLDRLRANPEDKLANDALKSARTKANQTL